MIAREARYGNPANGAEGQNTNDGTSLFDSAAQLIAVALSCWAVTYEQDEVEKTATKDVSEYWWTRDQENPPVAVAR